MLFRLLISLIFIFSCVSANSKISDDIYINGFIGVGYIYGSDNNFVDSDKNENKIIESALSLRYEYNDNLSFLGQFAYREFGEYSKDSGARIDYANITYSNSFIQNSEQSFSLGRVKIPIGVYNLSRDTPTTRPSLIMAQSAYLDLLRNLMMSTDGLLASTSHQIKNGVIDLSLGYGALNIDDNFSHTVLGSEMDGDDEKGTVGIADIRYNSTDLLFGVSYSDAHYKYYSSENDALPSFPVGDLFPDVTDGQVDITSYTAFLQYRLNKFEFTTEYTYRDIVAKGFTPTPPTSRPMEGYYAQLRYAVTPSLNLTVRYDILYRYADSKNGLETPIGVDPKWYNNSKTSSLSANYIIDEHWAVIADVHYVEGSAWLPPFSYQESASVEKKHWLLTAIEVVYSF